METCLIRGGSKVWFGRLDQCAYRVNSEDQRRALLRGAYSWSAVPGECLLGSPPANRECHSVGQSEQGKRDAD